MNSKFLAFADVYAYKIMRCEISLGGWRNRNWSEDQNLSLTPAAGLTFFPDKFLTQSYFVDYSVSFISVGDFSLSAEHVAIQQTVHTEGIYIPL